MTVKGQKLRGDITMNIHVIISKPGAIGLEEGNFTSIKQIESFIGGNLYCLPLPYEIDIWMNRDLQNYDSAPLNGCIVDEVDFSNENFLFGNIFFAGRGTNGGTLSLTSTQQKWINSNLIEKQNSTEPFVFRFNVAEMEVA